MTSKELIKLRFDQEVSQSASLGGISSEELMKDEDVEQLFSWFECGYNQAIEDAKIQPCDKKECAELYFELEHRRQEVRNLKASAVNNLQKRIKRMIDAEQVMGEAIKMQLSPVTEEELKDLPED